jgi:hypothetical protein
MGIRLWPMALVAPVLALGSGRDDHASNFNL